MNNPLKSLSRFYYSMIAAVVVVLLAYPQPAEAGLYRPAGKRPIKDRYIVVLKADVADVDAAADLLERQFGGRVLAVMKHAIRGFGIALNENQARALSRHPLVAMVEADEELQLAVEPARGFDFATANPEPRRPMRKQALANNCPWAGSYFLCTYTDADPNWFWHLNRLDNQGYAYPSQRTYAYQSTGAGVRAYVVDSGVYGEHQEFDFPSSRVLSGANMTWDDEVADPILRDDEERPINRDATPADRPCGGWVTDPFRNSSHGTAVASALGGTNTGVAKNVTIVPVKVMTCDGWMPKLAVARGLDWIQADMATINAQDNAAGRTLTRAVVNMSIYFDPGFVRNATLDPYPQGQQVCEDGNGSYVNCLGAIEHEINELVRVDLTATPQRRGIPVVVSANNQNNGNCSTTPARMGYGGNYATTYRTITVGATMAHAQNNHVDQRWQCALTPEGCDVTNFPTELGSNYGVCVSMYAPGWNVRTAAGTGPSQYRPVGAGSSGTSFAAPQVAGAIARLFERQPLLTSVDVWNELLNRTAQRWTANNFDPSGNNTRLLYMSAFE